MAKRSDKPFDESQYQASVGSELMAKLQETRRQIRLLEAQELGLIAEMDQHNIGLVAGYPSLRALLVDVLRVAPARATKLVNRATAVAETVTPTGHTTPAPLPTVRQALHDGLIDGDHLDAVADIMKELPTDTDLATRDLVEKTLGETARSANPTTVLKHGKTVLQHLDQDGAQPSDAEPEFTNSFTGQRMRDGSLKFKGHVDAETGEVLEKLFDKLAKPQKLSDRLPDPRSIRERHGDAFADFVHRVANPDGLGRTQISLTIDYDVLTQLLGTATLDSGCPQSPGAARRMCCDAGILPIVMKGPSVPLDVGRRRRLATPEQTQIPHRPGSRLHVSGLPQPGSVHRRPSPPTLGGWRLDGPGQHGAPLPSAPPGHPHRRLAGPHPQRIAGVHPPKVDRPAATPRPQHHPPPAALTLGSLPSNTAAARRRNARRPRRPRRPADPPPSALTRQPALRHRAPGKAHRPTTTFGLAPAAWSRPCGPVAGPHPLHPDARPTQSPARNTLHPHPLTGRLLPRPRCAAPQPRQP